MIPPVGTPIFSAGSHLTIPWPALTATWPFLFSARPYSLIRTVPYKSREPVGSFLWPSSMYNSRFLSPSGSDGSRLPVASLLWFKNPGNIPSLVSDLSLSTSEYPPGANPSSIL